ncbi:MAG: (5-formylfuran-3-yl)methyl phosphate synthase [Planctomycetaceae bacterium]
MIWRGLLVSVRDVEEAGAALAGGAGIIDVKEPAAGPLGAASPAAIAAVAGAVAGHRPWTFACGELAAGESSAAAAVAGDPRALVERVLAHPACPPTARPAAVKAGLAGLDGGRWPGWLRRIVRGLPEGTGFVGVAYADHRAARAPDPRAVIAAAAAAGCVAVLVDTCDKAGPGLFGVASRATVAAWVGEARAAGLPIALAGRLTPDGAALAAALGADVVAVRSAVCRGSQGEAGRADGDRLGRVDREAVGAVLRRLGGILTGAALSFPAVAPSPAPHRLPCRE